MVRRTFSKEYKQQTIKQVIEDGKRIAEVSSTLGITEQTIYRWLREYDKYGEEAFKGSGNPRVDIEYKIGLLEKKNNHLDHESDVSERNKIWAVDITYIPAKEGYKSPIEFEKLRFNS